MNPPGGAWGTGFRTDTVVTLFKDGVTTATVSPVTLETWGLSFTVPTTFTEQVGLLTIQAKNPQAEVGDAVGINVIETPVLSSLSPSSIEYVENMWGEVPAQSTTIAVSASKLPNDFSLCQADGSIAVSSTAAARAETSGTSRTESGFSFSFEETFFTGSFDIRLRCGSVVSNTLKLNVTRQKFSQN